MNNDLISRSELKKAIENYLEKRQDVIIWETDMLNMLDNAPTVDKGYDFGYADGHGEGYELGKNSRPQGEWIKVYSDLDYEEYQCSICGRVVIIYKNVEKKELLERYPFCNCGAKMKGGAK